MAQQPGTTAAPVRRNPNLILGLYAASGNQNAPNDMKATAQAWPLTLEFIRKHTR